MIKIGDIVEIIDWNKQYSCGLTDWMKIQFPEYVEQYLKKKKFYEWDKGRVVGMAKHPFHTQDMLCLVEMEDGVCLIRVIGLKKIDIEIDRWYRVVFPESFYDDMVGKLVKVEDRTVTLWFGNSIGNATFFKKQIGEQVVM